MKPLATVTNPPVSVMALAAEPVGSKKNAIVLHDDGVDESADESADDSSMDLIVEYPRKTLNLTVRSACLSSLMKSPTEMMKSKMFKVLRDLLAVDKTNPVNQEMIGCTLLGHQSEPTLCYKELCNIGCRPPAVDIDDVFVQNLRWFQPQKSMYGHLYRLMLDCDDDVFIQPVYALMQSWCRVPNAGDGSCCLRAWLKDFGLDFSNYMVLRVRKRLVTAYRKKKPDDAWG